MVFPLHEKIRVSLAQMNPTVGALEENFSSIVKYVKMAEKMKSDVLVFPELCLTGYPPEDLLFREDFLSETVSLLNKISREVGEMLVILGTVFPGEDGLFNSAAIIHSGEIKGFYHKQFLPNYSVFDEERYFQRGEKSLVIDVGLSKIGITICEDIWQPFGPALTESLLGGAEVIVSLNSSPYHVGKQLTREKMLSTRALETVSYVVYCNSVGGQDELVFDGYSSVFCFKGEVVSRAKGFEEDFLTVDLDLSSLRRFRKRESRRKELKECLSSLNLEVDLLRIDLPSKKRDSVNNRVERILSGAEEIYSALVLGVKDYVRKNGFEKAVIGVSGGIDSALTSVIAVDALGRENVKLVFMPSEFTSKESREDVRELSRRLGIPLIEIDIGEIFQSYLRSLKDIFRGKEWDRTEENIQARIRGNLLMALSNKFNWLVLNAGNKSEFATGYATLYGDMAGGFSVLKDVPKTMVYELAKYRNSISEVIPKRILEKPPSAELRRNQRDEDELGPYEKIDDIIRLYVEEDASPDEIVERGLPRELVSKITELIDRSEYKRRQGPPGIRISPRAFGKDRRYPITNSFRRR